MTIPEPVSCAVLYGCCEYGDLERLARTDGLDATLCRLRDAGVFITIDEFKCRQPIIRGSTTIHSEPRSFNNPFLLRSLTTGSSGSRSPGTKTTVNLDRSRYHALNYTLVFSAHGLTGTPTLLCMPILPSAAGLAMLLQSSKMRVRRGGVLYGAKQDHQAALSK
jgi:hypothetical protein